MTAREGNMKKIGLILWLLAVLLVLNAWAAAEATPEVSPEPTPEAETDMLAVDHRLYELGYRDGACNGVLDEVTVNALRNFQRANGLPVTGEPDDDTVRLLMSDEAVSQPDYLTAYALEFTSRPVLVDGSSGDEVIHLQRTLNKLGYYTGSSDGVYGAETAAAVCRFQLANGLEVTGVADGALFMRIYDGEPKTWKEFLNESCAVAGDSGPAVRTLQLWLKQKGYFNGECTGRFGDGTLQAVKRFQADNQIEVTGDADLATCGALYWNVTGYMRDSTALRRGETGADVDALCRDLAGLGYPAHGRFNMQTELALMQFQLVNKLPVTGVADDVTLVKMRSEGATRPEDYQPSGKPVPDVENLNVRIARQAAAMLGQFSELDTEFGFVQYVNLKCGVKLMNADQLTRIEVGPADAIQAGEILGVTVDGREILGISSADRALIYRADNGYIVMRYLDMMEADSICIYRMKEEA